MSGNWPNYPLVGERCALAAQSVDKGQDISNLETIGKSQTVKRKGI